MKTTKINSFRGVTTYVVGPYNVRVTRLLISERAGCGLRRTTSVCDWRAVDRADPVGGKTYSGHGGIRDAVQKLCSLEP